MLSKKLTKPKNGEKGFTLIELIIVIVILGIIAGVAVPQFLGLTDDARESVADGVGAAMNGTIAGLHAQWLINGAASEYTAATIIAGTNFGGIVPPVWLITMLLSL